MKKVILKLKYCILVLFLVIMSSTTLLGQSNYLMTEPSLKWNAISTANIGSSYLHYEYEMDTTISNIEYSKIGGYSNYLIRDDSGKVYITWLDGGVFGNDWDDEYLRYDFNLSAGDTFITSYPTSIFERPDTMIVSSVQYIMMANNQLRRVWTLTLPNFQSYEPFYWIEGIGSNYGFDYLYHFNTSVGINLTCFFDSSGLVYTGTFYPFDSTCIPSISTIEEFDVEKQITTYPNPVTDELYVDFNLDKSVLVGFRLFDLLGNLVFSIPQTQIGQQRFNINIPDGMNGVYWMVIDLPTQSVTRKIVCIK